MPRRRPLGCSGFPPCPPPPAPKKTTISHQWRQRRRNTGLEKQWSHLPPWRLYTLSKLIQSCVKGLVGNVTLYRRNYYSCFFFICTLNIILQLSTVKNLPFLVQVITEKAAETRIHLLMQGANGGDSGVYKCVPNNAPPAKIKVHILKGEQRMSCPNMLRFSITGQGAK